MKILKKIAFLTQFKDVNQTTVTTLYALSEKSLVTAIVYVLINILALYTQLGTDILVWGGIVIVLSLFRLYISYLFRVTPERYSIELWYKIFVLFSLLTALAISTLGFICIHQLNDYYQLYVLASLLGLTAGATISLSSDFRVALLYIGIIILPLLCALALQDSPLNILVPIMLLLFFFSQIIMIFKSYAQDKQIQDLMQVNKNLLHENKQFIADMVHQLKTPLTVIMANTSLIEMKANSNIDAYTKQINSSIAMLNNAYEDLSYIISNDTIEYKAIEIDFSHFIEERIDFFNGIAEDNHKTIKANISHNVTIVMNDTELERLIDNNISNAIKHSKGNSKITINLVKNSPEVILEFISEGKTIKNVSMVFEKNYTENHSAKRSLGLGLNMVKNICEKNHVKYSAHSEDEINTFTYIFKI